MKARILKTAIMSAFVAMSGGAFSASAEEKAGPFVEGTLGGMKFEFDSGPKSNSALAFGVGGGYQFNDILAAELQYVQGKWSDAKISSIQVGGKGTFNVSEQFLLYGRLGFQKWDFKSNSFGSGDGTDVYFGGGVGYDFDNLGITGGYNYMEMEDANATYFSFSLAYRF